MELSMDSAQISPNSLICIRQSTDNETGIFICTAFDAEVTFPIVFCLRKTAFSEVVEFDDLLRFYPSPKGKTMHIDNKEYEELTAINLFNFDTNMLRNMEAGDCTGDDKDTYLMSYLSALSEASEDSLVAKEGLYVELLQSLYEQSGTPLYN